MKSRIITTDEVVAEGNQPSQGAYRRIQLRASNPDYLVFEEEAQKVRDGSLPCVSVAFKVLRRIKGYTPDGIVVKSYNVMETRNESRLKDVTRFI